MSKQDIYQPWNIRKIFYPDCQANTYRVVKLSKPEKEMRESNGQGFTLTPDLVEFVGTNQEGKEVRLRATRQGRLYVVEIEPAINGIWNKNGRDYEKIREIKGLIQSAPFLFVVDKNTRTRLESELAEYQKEVLERKARREAS